MRTVPFLAACILLVAVSKVSLAEEYPVAEHPFLAAQCGGLFQEEAPIYRRPLDEMPLVASVLLGYYAASGGGPISELANRSDIIPGMLATCMDDPSMLFMDALAASVPDPMEPPMEPEEPVTYAGLCRDFFQRGEQTFVGTGPQFMLLSYFTIGYYAGADTTLDPVFMEDDRALMPALYSYCIDNPRDTLLEALAATTPSS